MIYPGKILLTAAKKPLKLRVQKKMQQPPNQIQLEKRVAVMLMDIQGDITALSEPYLNDAYRKATDQGAGKILLKVHAKMPANIDSNIS